MSVRIIDLRGEQTNPPPELAEARRVVVSNRTGRVLERHTATVDGIVIHQTACVFGPKSDPDARHRRALRVACHVLAYTDGAVVLANPMRWYVHHANALSQRSIGLEIEGLYPGLRSDPSGTTWKGDPMELDALTRDAGRAAIAEIVRIGRADGMPLRFLWAHRQSSGQRRSDPGEAIWRDVALWAAKELALDLQPELALESRSSGPGRPIPRDWGGGGVGPY